jgi:hypothetical protein
LTQYPALEKHIQFWDFCPSSENLTSIIEKIQKQFSKEMDVPLCLSVVAPYFFFNRDGLSLQDFSPGPYLECLRLFANNYTAQRVKIKTCKPILNRLYCRLAQLEPAQVDACPFLGKLNGIYTVDLSFIPEKYRLDAKHAEKILNRCLKEWLMTVESSAQGLEMQN